MEKIEDLFFYSLDKAIRTHRQYTQNRLRLQGYPITIDQWLLLTAISQNNNLSQAELCETIFKDKASLARMVELLQQKELLKKRESTTDKRKWHVSLTKKGEALLKEIEPIVLVNRKLSLEGVSDKEVESVKKVLNKIVANCNKYFNP